MAGDSNAMRLNPVRWALTKRIFNLSGIGKTVYTKKNKLPQ
jgi:hypothetical protein